MPDIHDVMDVTINDLSPEQQGQLKDAIDQFQQKCLTSFGKNRSGVPYLKTELPRVLLPGEPDSTAAQEKQEVLQAFRETMDSVMAKHHTAFLNMLKNMMVGVFGPGMEKMLNRVSPHTSSAEVGETSSAQPARDAGFQPPLQVNQSNRLCKAWEASQSSRLYKTMEVNQFSSRIHIKQCPIGLHMETWRSVHLGCHLILLTR
jgi:hypothetical protein